MTTPQKPQRVVRAKKRSDDGDAFFPDPGGGPAVVPDDFAEALAEEFVASATSGEEEGEEGHEQLVPEERGGPFIVTTAQTEFAAGVDDSNPVDAEPAPFPTTSANHK